MQNGKVLFAKGILHNKKMLTQSQLVETQFKGTVSSVKSLIDALKAINIGTAVNALVDISSTGMQLTVEDSNCFQAVLYITDAAFASFEQNGLARFNINLGVLCECLGIFHSPENSIRMIYKGSGAPLALIMEDAANNNCVIECSIRTQNETEPMEFDDDARVNQIVLRSGQFLEILNEVDRTCEEIQLTLSPNAPFFRVRTMGIIQSATEFQVDRTSESIISFNCKQRTCFSYKMNQIKLLARGLPLSSKISLSTDKNGLLTCQVILIMADSDGGVGGVASRDDSKMYIEYFILPLVCTSHTVNGHAETETETYASSL